MNKIEWTHQNLPFTVKGFKGKVTRYNHWSEAPWYLRFAMGFFIYAEPLFFVLNILANPICKLFKVANKVLPRYTYEWVRK